jgi:hypothetical protein
MRRFSHTNAKITNLPRNIARNAVKNNISIEKRLSTTNLQVKHISGVIVFDATCAGSQEILRS